MAKFVIFAIYAAFFLVCGVLIIYLWEDIKEVLRNLFGSD